MEDNKKHIDDLFREELGNHTETPPPAVWDALEKRLAEQGGGTTPRRWIWYVVIASLFVAISIIGAMRIRTNAIRNHK